MPGQEQGEQSAPPQPVPLYVGLGLTAIAPSIEGTEALRPGDIGRSPKELRGDESHAPPSLPGPRDADTDGAGRWPPPRRKG